MRVARYVEWFGPLPNPPRKGGGNQKRSRGARKGEGTRRNQERAQGGGDRKELGSSRKGEGSEEIKRRPQGGGDQQKSRWSVPRSSILLFLEVPICEIEEGFPIGGNGGVAARV